MATVNLGRIKPVFRGAYSGSTAYVVDDIVTHGNESFICIQAHGAGTQATTQGSYWTKLAAKGTDGTDVGTTLTTQGDILYRDGSGLQRLAKGTGEQILQMNSGATAPEWADASGGAFTQFKVRSDSTEYTNTSQSSYLNATNHYVDITPTSSSADVLIHLNIQVYLTHVDHASQYVLTRTVGGSTTDIFTTNSASNYFYASSGNVRWGNDVWFKDSPSTTSAIRYSHKFRSVHRTNDLRVGYGNPTFYMAYELKV